MKNIVIDIHAHFTPKLVFERFDAHAAKFPGVKFLRDAGGEKGPHPLLGEGSQRARSWQDEIFGLGPRMTSRVAADPWNDTTSTMSGCGSKQPITTGATGFAGAVARNPATRFASARRSGVSA